MALAYWNQKYPFQTLGAASDVRARPEVSAAGIGLGIFAAAASAALNSYVGQRWFGSDARAGEVAWDSAKGAAVLTGAFGVIALVLFARR